MQSMLYVLGLGVGIGLVVQVGMNSTLRSILGSPILAALVSFVVGSVALACFAGLHCIGWTGESKRAGSVCAGKQLQ